MLILKRGINVYFMNLTIKQVNQKIPEKGKWFKTALIHRFREQIRNGHQMYVSSMLHQGTNTVFVSCPVRQKKWFPEGFWGRKSLWVMVLRPASEVPRWKKGDF